MTVRESRLLVVTGGELGGIERRLGVGGGIGPHPIGERGMVVALLHGELERLEAERLPCLDLLGMLGLPASAVDQAQGLRRKRPAVHVVQAQHVERRGRGALLLVAMDAPSVMAGARPHQTANRTGVGVEAEQDRLLARAEELGEAVVRKSPDRSRRRSGS